MIKLGDTALLAFTKLRTRKIRTIITVVLASLLFGILIAASLVVTGLFRSVEAFRKDGLTSRYIVSVNKAPGDPMALYSLLRDPVLIKAAKSRYAALVEKKTAEAKRLGLTYTQASDQPPYTVGIDGVETLAFSDPNEIVHNLLAEKYSGQPAFDDARLRTIANRYHAVSFFDEELYAIRRGSTLVVLPSGGEKFYDQSDEVATNANHNDPVIDSFMTISPSNSAGPFMFPGNGGWEPASGSLPIILPQNIVEQLLGLEKLPDNADARTKLTRLKEVRDKAKSFTFQACYRNSASVGLIQRAIQQQKDIKAHVNDKDFQKPTLIYDLPDSNACANPTVMSDTRSAAEKKADNSQDSFDQEFGDNKSPVSYFVSFKVVGVSPAVQSEQDIRNSASRNLSDILSNLLATSGIGQTVPKSLYDQIPDKSRYGDIFTFQPTYLFGNDDGKQRYVEFANAADATRFIDEQSCVTQYDNTCKPLGRLYQATLSFSNSVALDDIRAKVNTWFGYALIGIIILAAAIMWITISRTIADGRRETAVFRAIGFKRIDIALIYSLYTVFLSILVSIFALCIGLAGALIVNQKLGPALTAQAQYGFGGLDLSKTINLVGVDTAQISLVLLACLITGIVSMIIPLLRNVRRSPIRDMRDEL